MLESLIEKKHCEMGNKLTGMALANFEAKRDVWQEVLDGVREIKAGGGKRTRVDAKSYVVRVRIKRGLSQAEFAAALDVSKCTLEQWEQGRRKPSGAAKHLLKIAERHTEVLVEIAA
ncbi:MAG: type II toxin-antitoxin system MqsA family antitoxin [Nitrospira sp.]|nr:type II toxin-antitoxin system MqsA family antitoxin [Nitrospira sp.]